MAGMPGGLIKQGGTSGGGARSRKAIRFFADLAAALFLPSSSAATAVALPCSAASHPPLGVIRSGAHSNSSRATPYSNAVSWTS